MSWMPYLIGAISGLTWLMLFVFLLMLMLFVFLKICAYKLKQRVKELEEALEKERQEKNPDQPQ